MKRKLTFSVIVAALFAFVMVGCSSPEFEEPVLPQGPETETEFNLEEEEAKLTKSLATRAGSVQILRIIVRAGHFEMSVTGLGTNLDHQIRSTGVSSQQAINLTLNNNDFGYAEAEFTGIDVVYCYGDPDIAIGLGIRGSAVVSVEVSDANIEFMNIGHWDGQVQNIEYLRLPLITSLKSLLFVNTSITRDALNLANLPNLTDVIIDNCNIAGGVLDLSQNTNLVNLNVLCLSNYNSFPTIKFPTSADSLKALVLINTTRFNGLNFANFPNLEHLRVENVLLSSADLSQNTKLYEIYWNNRSTSQINLPVIASGPRGHYDFSNCSLRTIDINRLKNARYINLESNQLRSIPDLRELVHLSHLDVSYNMLRELKLYNPLLEVLDCSLNLDMSLVSADISSLSNLRILNMSNVWNIRGLFSFAGLDNLEDVDMTGLRYMTEANVLASVNTLTDRNGRTQGKVKVSNVTTPAIQSQISNNGKNWVASFN